jgi:LPS-assembly lipoprotein
MIAIKKIFILFTLLLVSACGYHLRGAIDLPDDLKNIYIQGASSQLTESLKKSLRFSDGKVVETPAEAGMVVQVIKEDMRRRVLSLSSTGRANEYELYYLLGFILLDAEGNKLSEKQTIELSRDYFNDQEDVLGKANEEQLIRKELYRKAVRSIITRSRIALEKGNN